MMFKMTLIEIYKMLNVMSNGPIYLGRHAVLSDMM